MTILLLSKFVLLIALAALVALYIWAELPERE
jgi:hypothetical protein